MKKLITIIFILTYVICAFAQNDATLKETIEWINSKVNMHKHRNLAEFNISSNGIIKCVRNEISSVKVNSVSKTCNEQVTYIANIKDINNVTFNRSRTGIVIESNSDEISFTKVRDLSKVEKYWADQIDKKVNGKTFYITIELYNDDDIANRLYNAFDHAISFYDSDRKAAKEKKELEENEAKRKEELF